MRDTVQHSRAHGGTSGLLSRASVACRKSQVAERAGSTPATLHAGETRNAHSKLVLEQDGALTTLSIQATLGNGVW